MNVRFECTATSPLLMHNPQMMDPEFELTRQLAALTKKRNKTDEDYAAIAKLEWYGGLYQEHGTIVQPTAKLRKCFQEAAKITKQGKSLERALSFSSVNVPLIYDGPRSIDELFLDKRFHSRLSVGIRGKRVMRTRPSFMPWKLIVDGLFITDVGLNLDELVDIAEKAGLSIGIGDNRVNGYGRFTVKVAELQIAAPHESRAQVRRLERDGVTTN